MPEIPDRFHFEPDENARQAWLATRKRSTTYKNHLTLPGFYHTADFEKDVKWVMLAACVESAAIALTLYGGFTKGGLFILGSIITVLLFVLFDILGATFFHKKRDAQCLLLNQKLLTNDTGIRGGMELAIMAIRRSKLRFTGVALIVLSSLLKIAAILLLGSFELVFYLIMALLYVMVIYIHLTHTGYFFAERTAIRAFLTQYKKYARDCSEGAANIRYQARILQSTIDSSIKLNIGSQLTVGEHRIRFAGEQHTGEDQVYQYILETHGILLDGDIMLFLNNQSEIQAGVIILACLKHQVHTIHP